MNRIDLLKALAALPILGGLIAPACAATGELPTLVEIPKELEGLTTVKAGEMLVLRFPVHFSTKDIIDSLSAVRASGVKVIALRGDIEVWRVFGDGYASFPVKPEQSLVSWAEAKAAHYDLTLADIGVSQT
jgi:hypothetical protein